MASKRPVEEISIDQEIQPKKQKISIPPNIRYIINSDKKVLFVGSNKTKKLPNINNKILENIHEFITIEEINNISEFIIKSDDVFYIYKRCDVPRRGKIYDINICSYDEDFIKNTLYRDFSLKKFIHKTRYIEFIRTFLKDFENKYPKSGEFVEKRINPHGRNIDDDDGIVHPIIPILKKRTDTNIDLFNLNKLQIEQLYKEYCDYIAELLSDSEIELS
jgi:hypothetical protein